MRSVVTAVLCLAAAMGAACKPVPKSEVLKVATYNTHLISPGMRCLENQKPSAELLASGAVSVVSGAIWFSVVTGIDQSAQLVECLTLGTDKAKHESKLVADEILKRDLDVIALNEVFDEDARQRLVDLLSPQYPHYVRYIDHGLNLEDSGLMLFSKYPFAALPKSSARYTDGTVKASTDQVAFTLFDFGDSTGTDAYAAKGAAYVRIENNRPGATFRFYNVVFTHMQADYDSPGENQDKRVDQLKSIHKLMEDAIGKDDLNKEPLLFMGDLNVEGSRQVWNGPPPNDTEWQKFANRNFGIGLLDGWAATTSAADAGITHPDDDQRLDYIYANTMDGRLCVHHMTIADLGNSDHIGVTAELNLRDHYCDPRRAWQNPPFDTPLSINPAVSQEDSTRIANPGSMQWFRVDLGDDYSAGVAIGVLPRFDPASGEGVLLEMYAPFDLSTPIPPYSTEVFSLGHFPVQKYAAPKEFYIRVFSPNPLWTGNYDLMLHRLQCTNPKEDACILAVNNPVSYKTLFHAGKNLGADDTAWFNVEVTDRADNGAPQQLRFFAADFAGQLLTLESRDPANPSAVKPLAAQTSSNTATSQSLSAKEVGPLSVLLALKRSDINRETGVKVGWESTLTRLHGLNLSVPLSDELKLVCDDETDGAFGSEAGEDEIALHVRVDKQPFKKVTSQDFDCNNGNVSVGLDNQIGVIRFLDEVVFTLYEEDGPILNPDDESQWNIIKPLPVNQFKPSQEIPSGKPDVRVVNSKEDARWEFEGGKYHLEFSLSHQRK